MQASTTYLDDDDFATIVNTLDETHKWTFTISLNKHIDDKSWHLWKNMRLDHSLPKRKSHFK